MKILCHCGHIIFDQTDFLSYKARFLADQDEEDRQDALSEAIRPVLLAGLKKAHNPEQTVDKMLDALMMEVIKTEAAYLRRHLYQCKNCQRLYIDDNQGQLHAFVPQDQETSRDLLQSSAGKNWKAPLRGHWQTPEGKNLLAPGTLFYGSAVFEQFSSWEALEARYYRLFETLQKRQILRDAFLKRDGEIVHHWPLPNEERSVPDHA